MSRSPNYHISKIHVIHCHTSVGNFKQAGDQKMEINVAGVTFSICLVVSKPHRYLTGPINTSMDSMEPGADPGGGRCSGGGGAPTPGTERHYSRFTIQ